MNAYSINRPFCEKNGKFMKQSILDLPFDLKLSQDPRTQTSFICIVFIIIIVTIIIIIIII